MAQTDYQLKLHARNLLQLIAGLQEIRQGVRDARHKTGN